MPWPRRVTRIESRARTERRRSGRSSGSACVRCGSNERSRASRNAWRANGGGGATLAIDCASASAPYPDLDDDESYSLKIDASQALLTAATEWGVLRGLATLAQLSASRRTLPGVIIADTPRFAWRGLMVDSARHFISVATLLRTLDAMALVKLNVLHLHLTDDQGFRFASRAFPELAALGSDDDYVHRRRSRRHRRVTRPNSAFAWCRKSTCRAIRPAGSSRIRNGVRSTKRARCRRGSAAQRVPRSDARRSV